MFLVSVECAKMKLIEPQAPRVSQTLVGEMYKNTNYASQNLESVLKIKAQMKYGGSEIVGI